MRLSCLRLTVDTSEGRFGAEVPLDTGVNFITAGNNSGKSTILNSILYTLGLEEILGKQGPESLKPALRDELKYKGSKYSVLESSSQIELLNSEGEAITIHRAIIGEENHRLVRVKPGRQLTSADQENTASEPYYLHDPGAAQREKGFHNFLSDFLDLDLPRVPTYKGREVPLYLQCVFPLLFIEQQRGWSQIQATTPTWFGIRNVKQKAIEYILDLDVYEIQSRKQEVNIKKEKIRDKWRSVNSKLEGIAEGVGGVLKNMPSKPTTSISVDDAPNIFYPMDEGFVSVDDYLISLRERFEDIKKDAEIAYKEHTKEEEEYADRLEDAEEDLMILESRLKSIKKEINQERENLNMLNKRISSLTEDIEKNRDAKKLREYGADLGMSMTNDECPTCHQSIDGILLDQNEDRSPMSIDKNIEFLKMQKSATEKLREESKDSIEEKEKLAGSISSKVRDKRQEIKDLKSNLTRSDETPDISEIRETIKLDEKIQELEEAKDKVESSFDVISSLSDSWRDILAEEDNLPDDIFSSEDQKKLDKLSEIFRLNVDKFGYTSTGSENIDISRDMYEPTIEGFEVTYDASASDNIRMIWAYTLALQEVSALHSGNHPDVSFYDEPGQQNIDSESRKEFYSKMNKLSSGDSQFLIATSEDTSFLKSCVDWQSVNIIEFSDRVISPI